MPVQTPFCFMSPIRIATRKSPLAQRQTDLVIEAITQFNPEIRCEKVLIITSGDKRQQWSLSEKGGKGLFTKEIEDALINGEADMAVHSAKDLPTEMPDELEIGGFLPRENAHDVIIYRDGLPNGYPKDIATSSPRRRIQGKHVFPNAVWSEIRGNVDTRLNKVAKGSGTEGTFLAAAGLNRLGIDSWEGLIFRELPFKVMVPAVGQGAVALQNRKGEFSWLKGICCEQTKLAVRLERALLAAMEGGCQTAMGAHFDGQEFLVFHEDWGFHTFEPTESDLQDVEAYALSIVSKFRIN